MWVTWRSAAPERDGTSSGACATRSATTPRGTARSRSPARAAGSSGWKRSRPRPKGSLASASSADTKSRSRSRRRRSRWRAEREGSGGGRRARGQRGRLGTRRAGNRGHAARNAPRQDDRRAPDRAVGRARLLQLLQIGGAHQRPRAAQGRDATAWERGAGRGRPGARARRRGARLLTNAHGLLKAEMRRLGSVVLDAADQARVPGGAALAVDRVAFAQGVHDRITGHPGITVARGEVTELESPGIVATGPLTSEALATAIARKLDASSLAFFDAIAPIVSADSLDTTRLFRASRYGKGSGDDYWNAPLTEAAYDALVEALRTGEQYQPHHEFDRTPYFEGCLPVEEMGTRGRDVLRFGPMKPVGLGTEAFAVVQLRQEDRAGQMWNLVGFQTRLKVPE